MNLNSSLQRIKASGADAVLVTLVGGGSVGFNISFAGFGLDKQAIRLGTLIEENTLAGIGADNSNRLYSSSGYFSSIKTDASVTFATDYYAAFGSDAPALNGLGQSAYEGLILLAALANKAGSFDVSAMDAAAEGTTWSTEGENTLIGRHMAQTIYLADASNGVFNVVASFDKVASSKLAQTDLETVSPILLLNLAWQISTLALVAFGLAVVFGKLRIMNMAHGEFVMIGAYAPVIASKLGLSGWWQLPMLF